MRKKIAVFICAISFDNQRRVLLGILSEAQKQDVDVYIFTCHVNYREELTHKPGAFKIMSLPELTRYDGVIIMKNTIQFPAEARKLVQRIRESRLPAVSIDAKEEGLSFVSIDSYLAQKKLVEHLIGCHHLTRIAYVTGLMEDKEARERLQGYRDAMREHGFEVEEGLIYEGCYDSASGKRAVDALLENQGLLPEAIVCANDAMAFGVVLRLKEKGYRVPGDVTVTGFDNDTLAKYYTPALTTIDRNQEELGRKAVGLLFDGTQDAREVLLESSLVLRESCGCRAQEKCSVDKLREKFVEESMGRQYAADINKNMTLELTGLESLEELYQQLKRYLLWTDVESFYLCMCDERELFEQEFGQETLSQGPISAYTDQITIPIAYERGEFTQYGSFPVEELLPESCRRRNEATFFVVTPVFFQEICYGYCVSERTRFAMENELYYSWMVNIGNALENIRKVLLLKQMIDHLNSMWMYDMLTKLYNRGGFYHLAGRYLEELKEEQRDTFMLFIDLDGLKEINDTLGHKQGDAYICAMGELLLRGKRQGDLMMRYGGDEFVVFGRCDSEAEARQRIAEIEQGMGEYTFGTGRHLEASIGLSLCPAGEIGELQLFIDRADEKMYELKREKKRGREGNV